MTYTKKQFLEDVKKEAVALKKHATPEEIKKLDEEILNPLSSSSCLYGLMTGDCFSERAAELIHGCCKRYFSSHDADNTPMESCAMEGNIKHHVNGTKVRGIKTAGQLFRHRNQWEFHFSSIEAYILTPTAKNKNLIDFLKGNRKDLVL